MVHPLFRLATARPQLLAEHVSAYADLLAEELSSGAAGFKRRLVFQLVALAAFAVAAVLVGMAVMLWAALPMGSLNVPWVLVLVPALPAALGVWASAAADASGPAELFIALRRQLADDAAMLRSTELA